MYILLKAFALIAVLGIGIAVFLSSWEPHMIHKIGQGSTLKLKIENEWSVTTTSPSGGYQPLTATSEALRLTLAIRSGRLFTKRINETEWSYYTEIIYGDEFSVGPSGGIIMDGNEIEPQEKTPLSLDKLNKFEPADRGNG